MNILIPNFSKIKELPDETIKLTVPICKLKEFDEVELFLTDRKPKTMHRTEMNINSPIVYNPKLFTKTELLDGTLKFELNTDKIEEYFEELGAKYTLTEYFVYNERNNLAPPKQPPLSIKKAEQKTFKEIISKVEKINKSSDFKIERHLKGHTKIIHNTLPF